MNARKKRKLEETLNWMCEHFRPFLIRPVAEGGMGWTKVDCIRTTKMALAFLKEREIEAKPLILSCLTVNKPLGEYLVRHKKSIHDLSRQEIIAIGTGRIHQMGRLGEDEEVLRNRSWRGHMAVAVAQSRFLDLTIDSVNDPGADFVTLKPFWLPVGCEIINSLVRGDGEYAVRSEGGEIVTYRGDPNNKGYENLDTWTAWHSVHDRVMMRARRMFSDRKD